MDISKLRTFTSPTSPGLGKLYGIVFLCLCILLTGNEGSNSSTYHDTSKVCPISSKVTAPQDAHGRLVLLVYLGSNTLELSDIVGKIFVSRL